MKKKETLGADAYNKINADIEQKHRDKLLEKKKKEYHSDNSKLKKYWQDYYDKNKDYLKKKR
jgi:hypothetical protein